MTRRIGRRRSEAVAGQRRAEAMAREQTEQQARRRARVAAVERPCPARGTDPLPRIRHDVALARSGEISAPSCRSTRALERASSEVSAPPTWLTPRASAAEQQRAVGDALVARNANRAAHLHRSRPAAELAGGLEIVLEARPIARLDQPPQVAQLDPRRWTAPRPAPSRFCSRMSSHMSGLLAARRVVSRAPVPYDTPPSRAVGERLGQGIRHGLREVAGPGQLPVVGRRRR